MKTIFRSFSIIILSIFTVVVMHAQTRNVGLNSFQFLNVNVGARNASMGSAMTAVYDIDQIFNNPAGTTLKDESIKVSLNYNRWLAGITQNCLGISYNWKDVGTVSLGIQSFGVSGIEADRDLYAVGGTDQATTDMYATYSYMDMGFSLTYSKYVLDNLSLGVTAKYLNETIDDQSAHSFAFDFGSLYDIGIWNWKIAARLSNLGSDVKFYDFNHPIPMTFSIGTSIMPLNEDLYKVLISAEALKGQDEDQAFFTGAEVTFFDILSLRSGYKFNYQGTQSGNLATVRNSNTTLGSATDISIEKFSFGVGVKMPVESYNVAIDYSYSKMNIINDVHRITIHFGMK